MADAKPYWWNIEEFHEDLMTSGDTNTFDYICDKSFFNQTTAIYDQHMCYKFQFI